MLTVGLEPIAVGDDIKVVRRDNYLNYEPGSHTNVFSRSAQGIVYDADGDAWGLHASSWEQLDREGDYAWRETVRLNAHGG